MVYYRYYLLSECASYYEQLPATYVEVYMTNVSEKKTAEYNMTFCILSGFAIIMVVAGHLGYGIMTLGDLFPYYSFHVPLFLFISGYFYKKAEEEHPLAYVKKKVKRLLVPYFFWNLIYGAVAWLMRGQGFHMGEAVSLRTLFLDPFLHGYQFIYNYAAWFVPVLFIIEMMNLLMRLIMGRIFVSGMTWGTSRMAEDSIRKGMATEDGPGEMGERYEKLDGISEWVFLLGSMAVGMTVIWLAIGGHVWGSYKAAGRILLLYPCFQMGQFYKKRMKEHDTLGNLPYFAIVLTVQVVLQVCCNGLAFSSVWCTGFANGPVIPYVTIVSGIAFWLRIARILTPVAEKSKAVRWIGQNTYTVMMHHVMVFMLIKMIIAALALSSGICTDFDFDQFYHNIDYVYLVNGAEHFKMVYLAAGIGVPLALRYLILRMKKTKTVQTA